MNTAVTVYTRKGCTVCASFMQRLQNEKIPYERIELDNQREKSFYKKGFRSLPIFRFNGEYYSGLGDVGKFFQGALDD